MIAYIKPFFNRKKRKHLACAAAKCCKFAPKRPFLPYFNSMFPGTKKILFLCLREQYMYFDHKFDEKCAKRYKIFKRNCTNSPKFGKEGLKRAVPR